MADNGDDEVHFHAAYTHDIAASSISSLFDATHGEARDPFDFTPYMDQVHIHSGLHGIIKSNTTAK